MDNNYFEHHESAEELRASHAPDPDDFGRCKEETCGVELTEEEADENDGLCNRCYEREAQEYAATLRHPDDVGRVE